MISWITDVVMQALWDPIVLHPVPCGYRGSPLLPLPGRYDIYFKLYSLSMNCIAPAYFACSMYRHQIGLEPPGSIERYREHLSEAFSPEILERVDCYNNELLRPFVRVGTIGLTMNLITTIVLVTHTLSSLRKASSLSEKARAHHRTMTRVLILQTLVPFCSILLPLGVCFALMRAHVDGSLIIPHCILAFSTHSFCESLLLILTTPLYRLRLKKWLRLKKDSDSWAAPSAVSINARQATAAQR